MKNFLKRFPEYEFYKNKRNIDKNIFINTNLIFENIISERTDSILNIYKDNNIYLLWSGGLDSTAMLLSFLKTNILINIIVTEFTEIEYYNLYHNIKNNININLIFVENKKILNYISNIKDGLILTGDLGDQLFLSPLVFGNEDIKNLPFRMVITDEIINKHESDCLDFLKNPINANVGNFLWMLDFLYKWDMVKNRLQRITGNKNIISFFDYKDFEIYSYNNQIQNSKWEGILYKKDMRDFIFKETGDEDYAYKKEKIGSQKSFLLKNFKDTYYENI